MSAGNPLIQLTAVLDREHRSMFDVPRLNSKPAEPFHQALAEGVDQRRLSGLRRGSLAHPQVSYVAVGCKPGNLPLCVGRLLS